MDERSKKSWNTNRCPYSINNTTLCEYNFFSCIDIGCDYLEWYLEFRECCIREVLFEKFYYLFSLDSSLSSIDIYEIYETCILCYRLYLCALVTIGIKCTDKGTHTRSYNKTWDHISLFESLDESDMSESARSATTEYEGKGFLRHI